MFSGLQLAIVCPMANEANTAVRFVDEVIAVCTTFGFRRICLLVVLDNASFDGTVGILNAHRLKRSELQPIWAPENKCVTDAYLRGYREALGRGADWILEIDAGFSHKPQEIPRFFDEMIKGHDAVFGSRLVRGGSMRGNSLHRRLLSAGGSLLTNLLLNTRLKDLTSGFQLFSRSALSHVLDHGIHSRGPFFQTEMKVHCQRYRIVEVPITHSGSDHSIGFLAIGDALTNLGRLFKLRLSGKLSK